MTTAPRPGTPLADGRLADLIGLPVIHTPWPDRWHPWLVRPGFLDWLPAGGILTSDVDLLRIRLEVAAIVRDKARELAAWAGVEAP